MSAPVYGLLAVGYIAFVLVLCRVIGFSKIQEDE